MVKKSTRVAVTAQSRRWDSVVVSQIFKIALPLAKANPSSACVKNGSKWLSTKLETRAPAWVLIVVEQNK
jgi:hypothetical protein